MWNLFFPSISHICLFVLLAGWVVSDLATRLIHDAVFGRRKDFENKLMGNGRTKRPVTDLELKLFQKFIEHFPNKLQRPRQSKTCSDHSELHSKDKKKQRPWLVWDQKCLASFLNFKFRCFLAWHFCTSTGFCKVFFLIQNNIQILADGGDSSNSTTRETSAYGEWVFTYMPKKIFAIQGRKCLRCIESFRK